MNRRLAFGLTVPTAIIVASLPVRAVNAQSQRSADEFNRRMIERRAVEAVFCAAENRP